MLVIAAAGIVSIRLPAMLATTRTDSVQIELALTLAPDMLICVAPAGAVIVAPLQPAPVKLAAAW